MAGNRRWPVVLAVALAVQSFPNLARAVNSEASAVLRVRSTPHFTALRVWPDGEGARVEGFLHDEQNAPVVGARVHTTASSEYRPCSNQSMVTDEQGHFCLRFGSDVAGVALSFPGNLHFDSTTVPVSFERAVPPPSLAIDTSSEWFIGRRDNTVRVLVDNAPADAAPRVELRILAGQRSDPLVLTSPVDERRDAIGGVADFIIDPTQLPPAGPIELEANLVSGSSDLATAVTSLELVAVIDLSVSAIPDAVRSRQAFTLEVLARGDASVVNGGWIEVRDSEKPLAIEPVRDGSAQLTLELAGSREHSAELTIQYVPDVPWYRAGSPLVRDVVVLGPLPWVHLPWAILAIGAGLWVVRTWRRPARAILQSQRTTSPVPVARIDASSGPSRTWRGTVRDAHTKRPLAQVRVVLHAPTLHAVTPIGEAVTDNEGKFDLPEVAAVPEGARLLFTSKDHSTLNQPAPGPCVLEVDLVERRRTLLAAFHAWVRSRSLTQLVDPTPQLAATTARSLSDSSAESWSLRIDEAVYGPVAPDGVAEEQLLRERPGPGLYEPKVR